MSKNNLYVKNLGNLDDDDLWCLFNEIGETTSHEISRNSSGHSKGFGFVRFQDEMDAKIAISKLNGQLIGLEPLYVSYFQEKKERKNNLTNEDNNFGSQLNLESQFLSFVKTQSLGSKIFVKRLHEDVHDIDLNHLFAQFGSITSCYVLRGKNGRSIGSGVVNFSAKQEALNAIRKMNGSMFMTKKLCVEFFECKNEKKKESSDIRIKANSSIKSASLSDLSTESAQTSNINPRSTKDRVKNDTKNCNLRIENLDDDVDDNGLYQLFSCYGTIVSAKVMTYNNRKSKGYGFVCYKTSEEASKAFSSMNGFQLASNKTLVITYYEQRKKLNFDGNKNDFEKANSSIKSASLSDLSTESAQTSNINPRSTKDSVKNDTNNCNLRIENLDDDVDDNGLYQLFSRFGKIVSAKVMTYNNRKSKGYGFVCYKTSEEASEAFSSMNGYQLPSNKTLVITYYEQRKKMNVASAVAF